MNCLRAFAWSSIAVFAVSLQVDADSSSPSKKNLQQIYANLAGAIALENDRVLVQRFIVQPGQSTGRHAHAAHQLVIFVKGGVLTSQSTGRSSVWPDGRVVWQDRAGGDEGGVNAGRAPIELLWVTLKPTRRAPRDTPPGKPSASGYLNYPSIPGEDLLENDFLIVQRFKMNPGDWEGVHAHNPNTFYVFIKGGQYLSKSKEHPEGVPGSAADGTVAWMDTIDLSDQHQSGNVGTNSTEVVWVALKK